MSKFGARKRPLDNPELPDAKRQKDNFQGSLNAEQRYQLFCKGPYHPKRNPEGLVRMTEFQKNDMGGKSVRFVPKNSSANFTGFTIGTLKEPVEVLVIKNQSSTNKKDSDGKWIYKDLDKENECTRWLKMKSYPVGHQYHNTNNEKEFIASREIMKSERLAIEFNTLDKIDRINEETEKMMKKKKPKKSEIRAALRTILGDEWFFDEINVDDLQEKIDMINAGKYDKSFFEKNIYNPFLSLDPRDETGQTMILKIKGQMVIADPKRRKNEVKVFKVMNPGALPGEKLDRKLYNHTLPYKDTKNPKKTIDDGPYRNKLHRTKATAGEVLIGYFEGFYGTFNPVKGWGMKPHSRRWYIIKKKKRQEFSSGYEVNDMGTANPDDLDADDEVYVPNESTNMDPGINEPGVVGPYNEEPEEVDPDGMMNEE